MRHRKAGKKLGRTPSHRRALFNNLLVSFFEHERIETTDTKAKELKRLADRMITLGKKGTLAARRQAAKNIRDPYVLRKLFDELAGRYAERPGGYSRVTKLRVRRGDAAPISVIELIPADEEVPHRVRKGAATAAAPAAKVTTKESFAEEPEAAAEATPEAEAATAVVDEPETVAEEVAEEPEATTEEPAEAATEEVTPEAPETTDEEEDKG